MSDREDDVVTIGRLRKEDGHWFYSVHCDGLSLWKHIRGDVMASKPAEDVCGWLIKDLAGMVKKIQGPRTGIQSFDLGDEVFHRPTGRVFRAHMIDRVALSVGDEAAAVFPERAYPVADCVAIWTEPDLGRP